MTSATTTGADSDATKGATAKGAFSNKPAEDRRKPIERYERGLKPTGDRPAFHFLHANLPHFPWEYLPTGQRYLVNGPQAPGLKDEWWSKEPYAARLGMQRHLLQTGYADRLIGRTVSRLRRAGLFDRAMVIFTADHGVSFRPGRSRRAITRETAADIAAVPLFVKYPGQRRGRIDTSMVRNIDVVPTIAKQVGAELAWRSDGRAVRDGGPRSGTVRVSTGTTADPVELSFADFVRERERGLRRMLATFGSDDGGAGLYATGPDRGLLGRPVAGLPAAGSAGRVNLDSTTLLASFRPGGLAVPSFVTGKISGRAPVGSRVAVAVNGTVRGVSVTFREDGRHRFAVMVPPSAFRRGANAVDVYAAEGPVGSPRLAALSTEQADQYRLVERGGSITIVGPSGRIPVERGRIDGFIDSLVAGSGTLRIGGWALERRTRGPVGAVLVFDGSRFLTSGEPNLPRPDIARLAKIDPATLGYRLTTGAEGVDRSRVRVFAIAGGTASELPRFKPRRPATDGEAPRR